MIFCQHLYFNIYLPDQNKLFIQIQFFNRSFTPDAYLYQIASFMDFTYSPTNSGASFPWAAKIFTMADPTITPSAMSTILAACSGVEIPNPMAQGMSVFWRTTSTMDLRSVFISLPPAFGFPKVQHFVLLFPCAPWHNLPAHPVWSWISPPGGC